MRREAAADFTSDSADAANDLREALADPDERAGAQRRYQKEIARIGATREQVLAKADAIAAGKALPNQDVLFGSEAERRAEADRLRASAMEKKPGDLGAEIRLGVAKAIENPEYYLTVLFTWAHRLVMLLLPIMAAYLSLLYVYKRRFFVYDHLIIGMNFLSFLFLTYAVGFWLPLGAQPFWLLAMLVFAPLNLFMTFRGAYGSSLLGAGVKAVVIWGATVVSFVLLVAALLFLALFQL